MFDLIKPGIDAGSREKVENALYELFFKGQWLTQASAAFITMDLDNLTLLLVIMMGVLGSALQITHAFVLRNQAITISGYLLRISLGAITALVMFIVAKAGVPVVTDASRLGGDAPINPHFVAFLAITQGSCRRVRLPTCSSRARSCSARARPAPTAGRGATSRRSSTRRDCRVRRSPSTSA